MSEKKIAKATYYQRGEVIDYKNTSTTITMEAGTITKVGSIVGVIGADIAPGETGPLNVSGVFQMPKASTIAVNTGEYLCFDESKGQVQKHKDGDVPVGYAAGNATAGTPTVLVKLSN